MDKPLRLIDRGFEPALFGSVRLAIGKLSRIDLFRLIGFAFCNLTQTPHAEEPLDSGLGSATTDFEFPGAKLIKLPK